VFIAACVPSTGWERSDNRVCAADSPAFVCVHAWPDRAVELQLGDERILPGECVFAPKGGSTKVVWTDSRGVARDRRVFLRKHVRTELALGQDGELHVAERMLCDTAMPPFEP
jgi:hypothetical protein